MKPHIMLKNILQYSIAPLIIGAISGGIYITRIQSNGLLQSILVVIFSGILITLLFALQKPPIWFIKNRYWFFGTFFGLFLFIQHTILVDFHNSDHLLFDMVVSIILGNVFLGSLIIMVNANGNGLQRHGFD